MSSIPIRPLREDVISADPPGLRGIDCGGCDKRSFPSREVCPFCGNHSVEQILVSTHGTVASWTVVHQAPPPLKTPYQLVTVDLDDGVRLLGSADGDLRIGTPVEVELHELKMDDDGNPLSWYRFREERSV